LRPASTTNRFKTALGVLMMFKKSKYAIYFIAIQATITPAIAAFGMQNGCAAQSAATVTPVIELYTSEGCSSCPPADKWLSTLKNKAIGKEVGKETGKDLGKDIPKQSNAVVQAFHVGYWDYIGWADRFATPSHTQRQKQISAWNKQNGIYHPFRFPENWPAAASASSKSASTSLRPPSALSQTHPVRPAPPGRPIGR
jgi:Protein of unknown function (DUF1223)